MTLARFEELLAACDAINRRHRVLFDWVEVFTDRVFRDLIYARARPSSKLFTIDGPGLSIAGRENKRRGPTSLAHAQIDTRPACSSQVIGDHEHERTRVVHDPRMGDIRQALLMFLRDEKALAFKEEAERYIDHMNEVRRVLIDQLEENLVRLAHELPIPIAEHDPVVVYHSAAANFVTHKAASYYARGRVALEATLVCEPLGIPYVIRPPPYDDSPRVYELEASITSIGWQIASRRADRSPGAIVRGCKKLGLNPRVIDPNLTDLTP